MLFRATFSRESAGKSFNLPAGGYTGARQRYPVLKTALAGRGPALPRRFINGVAAPARHGELPSLHYFRWSFVMNKLLFAAFFCLSALAARAEIVTIGNAELARLAARGVPVIDVRTEKEWKETGVIPGSRLITYFDENGKSNPPQWLEKFKAVAAPGQPVILVCRSGRRSAAATQFLAEQAGYKTVYNVGQGINGWVAEGRAVVAPPLR